MQKANDNQSFIDALIKQYSHVVTAAAKKHLENKYPNSGISVEDLVQETFITAWEKTAKMRAHPNVIGWLIVTMKNKAKVAQREVKKQAKILDILAIVAQNADSISSSISELIEELSSTDQEVLTLFYMQKQKIRNISNLLNISESAVKVRLHRARKHLESLGRAQRIIK